MLSTKTIATYLIYKRIVSNHKIEDWIEDLKYSESKYGNNVFPDAWFLERVRCLEQERKISVKVASFLLQASLWRYKAEALMRQLQKNKIMALSVNDKDYPNSLKNIVDRPYVIFTKGHLSVFNNDLVTIVGTRNCSKYGELKTNQLVQESVNCGLSTVSGFARGVDTIVLVETLRAGGNTIAVLPELHIGVKSRLGVTQVAEYLSSQSQSIQKWQYVARNRIAAALSPYTIVVEAPIRSGTLITANLALDYGKDVYNVLPDIGSSESYGGIAFTQSRIQRSQYILSMYDIFWDQEDEEKIRRFYEYISKISNRILCIPNNDYRNLYSIDLRRYIMKSVHGDLEQFDKRMVELLRLGVIIERKNRVVFNFANLKRWQKT